MAHHFFTQAPIPLLEDHYRKLLGPPLPMFFSKHNQTIVNRSHLHNQSEASIHARLQDVEFKRDDDSTIRCFYYVMLEVCFSSLVPANQSINVLQKFKEQAYRSPINISPQGVQYQCLDYCYRLKQAQIMKLLVDILDLAPFYRGELPKLINLFPIIDTLMILIFRSFCSPTSYANSNTPVHINCLMDFIRHLGIQCTMLLNKMILFNDLDMTYTDNGMSCHLRYMQHQFEVLQPAHKIRQVTVESIEDSDGSITSYIVGSEYEPQDQLLKMCKVVKSIRKKASLKKIDSRVQDFSKDGSFHLNIRHISQQSQYFDSQQDDDEVDEGSQNVQSIIVQSPNTLIQVFDANTPTMPDLNGISPIRDASTNSYSNVRLVMHPVCLEGAFYDQDQQTSPTKMKPGNSKSLQKTNDKQQEQKGSETKQDVFGKLTSQQDLLGKLTSSEQFPPLFMSVKKQQSVRFDCVYVKAGQKSVSFVSFDRRKSLTSTINTPRTDIDALCVSPPPWRQFRSEINLRCISPTSSFHAGSPFEADTRQQLLH